MAREELLADANRGWSTGKLDADALYRHLSTLSQEIAVGPANIEQALFSVESLNTFLFGACEASMPRNRPGPEGRRPCS